MLETFNIKQIYKNVNLRIDSLSPGRLRTLSDNKGLHFDFSIVSKYIDDTLDAFKSEMFAEKYINDIQLVDITITILTMHLIV